ncbi:tetratricopeptide repeat protein 37-like [Montipora capricornis]|uniref:tetratricopeptide repeat protein 37-like n=1 Tax=Montipora capricornis TaxID=246305 RepID=UPI0035F14FD8
MKFLCESSQEFVIVIQITELASCSPYSIGHVGSSCSSDESTGKREIRPREICILPKELSSFVCLFFFFSSLQRETVDRDRWNNLALEASSEVLKWKTAFTVAYLIQGIVYFLQDNTRSSKRALQHVLDDPTVGGSAVAQYWLLLVHLKKKDVPAAQDLLAKAKIVGNARLDLLYYRVAENKEFAANIRRRLIEKCIHINPSERVFWNSPSTYSVEEEMCN